MIAYSTRLAWRTTWIAMVLSIVALAPWPWLPVAAELLRAAHPDLAVTVSTTRTDPWTVHAAGSRSGSVASQPAQPTDGW